MSAAKIVTVKESISELKALLKKIKQFDYTKS